MSATASGLLDDLDTMMSGMNKRYNALVDECHRVAADWDGLKRAGGGRDDHAASYLQHVAARLNTLAVYTDKVRGLLAETIAKPFGE